MPLITDVETALNDLIAVEAGFKFQSLAVVLAKQKWPRLIASQRKYDVGLDAHAPGDLEPDGRGKGLASSLTADYDKIASDASKVKKNYPDVRVLIFATAGEVTKHKEKQWAEQLLKEFGLDLVVMPREDLVTSLIDPSNADICRSQLGIHIEGKPELQSIIALAHQAVAEVVGNWAHRPRLVGRPLIDLEVEKVDEGRDSHRRLRVDDLHASLAQGQRIILEAPAGRGKTTTLVQVAQRTIAQGGLAFLVDLPFWLRREAEILQFISQTPAFAKRGLDAKVLHDLRGSEPFFFLLNGWNEISEGTAESAVQALRELEQNYPSAGIIVATRTHRLRPPLPGAFRAQLLTLRRSQRDQYLALALGKSANELSAKLNNNRMLDELTRTPLILAEVTELYRKGRTIPTTKMGVLAAMMRVVEESEEHHAYLQQAPLSGHAREYLSALSIAMNENGAVEISEADGRAIINSASTTLQKADQLSEKPDPMTVLNELTKHHVLERMDLLGTTFRFQHQQFQEFFATRVLEHRLLDLIASHDADLQRRFAKQFVNEPRWGESLRLLAESNAEQGTKAEFVEAGARLVRMSLHVDAIFAAELANASGPAVWAIVRIEVGNRLRAWYAQEDAHHRQCALAAMLATGSDDFKDILEPLLGSADDQVRLAVFHGAEVLPTSLGPNWREVFRTWPEGARATFVAELAGNPWLADSVEEIALADPSPTVRWNAAFHLSWHGFEEKVERLMNSLDDTSFREAVRRTQIEGIPTSQWPRVAAAYEQMYKEANDPFERLRLLQVLMRVGGTGVVERMKAELDGLAPGSLKPGETQGQIRSVLDALQKSDPNWVSEWTIRRVLDRSVWFGPARDLITQISTEEREALYSRFSSELLDPGQQQRLVSVLVSVMDSALAARLLARAREIRAEITPRPGHDRAKWDLFHQVQNLLRAVDPATLLEGILEKLEKQPDISELDILVEVLPATNVTKPDVRSAIPEDMRLRLRDYLKQAAKLGADPNGLHAGTRAHLALLLANVGEPEDLEDIRRLIEADSARYQQAQTARMKGDHSQNTMGYGSQYLEAVMMTDAAAADDVIVELLIGDQQYVHILAERLPGLARKSTGTQTFGLDRLNSKKVWEARAGKPDDGFVEERRTRFADAIREQIDRIKHERDAAMGRRGFDFRLIRFGGALAALDGKRSAEIILELMELPGRWDGWTRVGALESLLSWGVRLTLEEVLPILEPVMQELRASGLYSDNQNAWLFARCLSVMAFVEPPTAGVAKIRALISDLRFRPHELGGVVAALGASRCEDAMDVVMEVAGGDGKYVEAIGESWINAIAALEGGRSSEILLSFFDSNAKIFSREFIPDHRHGDLFAQLLAGRAANDKVLKAKLLEFASGDLSPIKRMLLTKVFSHSVGEKELAEGLCVLRDDGSGIPYELIRSVENAFLQRHPYGTSSNAYTLSPVGCNAVRKRLFELVIDDPQRKKVAFALLGQIEVWRLEHGRPADEPRHPVIESEVSWPPLLS